MTATQAAVDTATAIRPPWHARSDYAKCEDLKDPRLQELYGRLEQYQDFYHQHLAPTAAAWDLPWPRDALRNWSRQWEYPYVASAEPTERAKVLDAGSGYCFFPFYWCHRGHDVEAVDYDARLASHFAGGRERLAQQDVREHAGTLNYSQQDIHALSFPDNTFDVTYSVSVLEHLNDQPTVVRELARVTKPDGTVVITADLSLDGRSQIRPAAYRAMLRTIEEHFDYAAEPVLRFDADVLVTDGYRERDTHLLPWRTPPFRLQWLLNPRFYLNRRRYRRRPFYSLAVVGLKLRKK